MIEEVIWNTGTADTTGWSSYLPIIYKWERSGGNGRAGCSNTTGGCSDTVQRTTTWRGKVGLMYPSDFGYATDGGDDLMKRGRCI